MFCFLKPFIGCVLIQFFALQSEILEMKKSKAGLTLDFIFNLEIRVKTEARFRRAKCVPLS